MSEDAGNMRRIGITGGIGSGKSAVTDRLRELGYSVFDADEVAREAAEPGEPAMQLLREEFGDDIFLENGALNRPALSKLMFHNPDVLLKVNEIFHPDIQARIETKINDCDKNDVVFLSAPLLFESGIDWKTDEVWLVTADEDKRIDRVMKRDGISEADVRARMDNQMSDEEKRALSDVVIDNSGTLAQLYKSVDAKIATDGFLKVCVR